MKARLVGLHVPSSSQGSNNEPAVWPGHNGPILPADRSRSSKIAASPWAGRASAGARKPRIRNRLHLWGFPARERARLD